MGGSSIRTRYDDAGAGAVTGAVGRRKDLDGTVDAVSQLALGDDDGGVDGVGGAVALRKDFVVGGPVGGRQINIGRLDYRIGGGCCGAGAAAADDRDAASWRERELGRLGGRECESVGHGDDSEGVARFVLLRAVLLMVVSLCRLLAAGRENISNLRRRAFAQ